jgi:hypothetical protein
MKEFFENIRNWCVSNPIKLDVGLLIATICIFMLAHTFDSPLFFGLFLFLLLPIIWSITALVAFIRMMMMHGK